jgi:hypothetical protein
MDDQCFIFKTKIGRRLMEDPQDVHINQRFVKDNVLRMPWP